MLHHEWCSSDMRVYSVRAFGAVGDGQTDDTRAIQAAIDAAAEVAGSVIFPAGSYACSMLKLRPHVTLTGSGTWTYWYRKGSIIRPLDDHAPCLLDATDARGATIAGLVLDGLGPTDARLGEKMHGVMVKETLPKPDSGDPGNPNYDDALLVDHCNIRDFSGDGLHLDGIWVFTVRHTMINANLGDGIFVHGYDGYVLDCWLAANQKAGYGAHDSLNASVTMTGNRIEWNHLGGIVIYGGDHYNITGNFFDACGGPGIWLRPDGDKPCDHFTMTGNVFRRNGRQRRASGDYANCHVRLDGGQGLVLTGNTMSSGRDDHGEGVSSPAYGIVVNDLDGCVIKDNALHRGAHRELVLDLGGHQEGSCVIGDNVGSLDEARG